MDFQEFKKELKEYLKVKKLETFSKNQLFSLERKYFEWLVQTEGKCKRCERTEKLTLDHIIPLSLLAQLGIDTEREFYEENLQLYCQACNHYKGSRLDFIIPKTKELLLKYIEKL